MPPIAVEDFPTIHDAATTPTLSHQNWKYHRYDKSKVLPRHQITSDTTTRLPTTGPIMSRKPPRSSRRNQPFVILIVSALMSSIWTACFFPSYPLLLVEVQEPEQTTNVAPAQSLPFDPFSRQQQKNICFINSVYGNNANGAAMDRPTDVTKLKQEEPDLYKFYYFTNLQDLETPGWDKILLDNTIIPNNVTRHITMSRYPKFLAWKFKPIIETCGLVVYLDGYWSPRTGKSLKFRLLWDDVQKHKYGLVQVAHPFGNGIRAEMERIVNGTKDTQEHVDLALQWLEAQSDFDDNCNLFWNGVFAYDPTNSWFQNASSYFWDRYSLEEDSWRDQPLWAYTLHHLGIEPIQLEEKRLLYYVKEILDNKGDHHYNESTVTRQQ